MSYDQWKTTNPADESLGPDPWEVDDAAWAAEAEKTVCPQLAYLIDLVEDEEMTRDEMRRQALAEGYSLEEIDAAFAALASNT